MKRSVQKTLLALAVAAIGGHARGVDFQKDIFPLLDQHCVECHSEDDSDGELKLDTFAGLIAGGKTGKAVEVGKGSDSLLVKFLEGRSGKTGKNQFMPPGKREHLSDAEIALFRAWIDAGAKGPAVVAGQKAVTRREVATPKIAPKGEVKRAIHALAFSEKAQFIAVGRYGEVELINPVTRAVVRKLAGFKGQVNALAFSPDGSSVFAAGGEAGIAGDVHRWRVADGVHLKSYEGHTDACYALAISPDGKQVATGGYDQKIKLWDAQSGAEIKTLKGHNAAVFGVSFRPDGKVLASASADRTVKLWSLPDGGRLDTFSQPTKEQLAVAFTPDGKHVLAGGADNRIRLWQVSANAKEGTNPLLQTRFAHEGAVLKLALSADGKTLASSASDKTVKIWNAVDVTEKLLLEKQSDWPQALAFANKTQFATGRLDGTLGVYDAATGKAMMPPPPLKADITKIEPRGAQIGATRAVTVVGKNLTAATKVMFSNPGIHGEILPDAAADRAKVRVKIDATVPRGSYDMWMTSGGGESSHVKLHVDDLPMISTSALTLKNAPMNITLPLNVWGKLTEVGQNDVFKYQAKKGETIVFDLGVKAVESKAVTPSLALLDASGKMLASNRGLDSGTDPFLAFKAPADGEYQIRVSEVTLEGSPDYVYRLTAGVLPYVTGWFPLSAQAGKDVCVRLIGHNLAAEKVCTLAPAAAGTMNVPLDTKTIRSRKPVQLSVTTLAHIDEIEPNDLPAKAQPIAWPASVNGVLHHEGSDDADADLFAIEAKAGKPLIIETLATLAGSPADTKIEILDAAGNPVPRLLLQAVRDSWINFRSVDADNPDIRLQNWQEMDLNDYVYLSGDVTRIFRLPRGPDSGFLFHAAGAKRRAYFDTSATAHSLDEPCYVVEPKPLGAKFVPNGLPTFTLNYANDDAGYRKMRTDSQLTFTAPKDGRYLIKVTDTRGWSGERSVYRLTVREPAPDFSVAVDAGKIPLSAGGAVGFSLRADRKDGFDGPIEVNIEGGPAGFFLSTPIIVQAGHDIANGALFASPDAPKNADWSKLKITACSMVAGAKVCKPASGFAAPALAPMAKFSAFIEPDVNGRPAMQKLADLKKPLELTIEPGKSVKAWIRLERHGNDALLNFDVHNLPFGIIVDNIGLNGVQVREKENERDIFFTCAKWVEEQDRLIHAAVISARTEQDSAGVQTSFPILLKVRKAAAVTAR